MYTRYLAIKQAKYFFFVIKLAVYYKLRGQRGDKSFLVSLESKKKKTKKQSLLEMLYKINANWLGIDVVRCPKPLKAMFSMSKSNIEQQTSPAAQQA